jgi:molybdopterin/thiamine biosynthesis adenylyltransferase
MTTNLHINPYRFRATIGDSLLMGSMNQVRQISVKPSLEIFEKGGSFGAAQVAALDIKEIEFLKQERFVVPYQIDDESRVSRQLGFFSLWEGHPLERQARLEQAKVVILGVGTLGTQVSYMLASAGVGTLILCDQDYVECSNLSRQMLFCDEDIGRPKVEAAKTRLLQTNPNVNIQTHHCVLESVDQIKLLISGADLVIRAVDFPQDIAFTIDLACSQVGIPHIGAGLLETWTMVGPFIDSSKGPSLSDLITPPKFTRSSYRRIPVFGPTSFWVASYVAGDALRHLADLSTPWTLNRVIYLDGRTGQMFHHDLMKPDASHKAKSHEEVA